MNYRRPLSAVLGEVAEGTLDGMGDMPVRIRDIEIDLPIDLRMSGSGPDTQLLGDVPLFLLRTAFDPPLSRLSVRWAAEEEGAP